MKILIYGDVHWSTHSSIVRSRGEKYSTRLENVIKSVNWAERLAETQHCDSVVCLGDFFDKPELSAEELSALLEVEWAEDKSLSGTVHNNKLRHYFIVGNHETTTSDLSYNSTNALNTLNNEKFTIVDKPTLINTTISDILFIPYVNEDGRKPLKDYWTNTTDNKKKIIFSHNDIKGIRYGAFLSQTGFELEDIKDNSDLFINGHLHNGMFLNDEETILNLGILTGQNFNEDGEKYPHYACVLDTETLEITFFENPHAFNFYKLEINKESDLNKLTRLKNNAVVTVRCEKTYLDSARDLIRESSNIVEHRLVSYKADFTQDTEDQSHRLQTVDHLKQFYDFVLATVEEGFVQRDILIEELIEVIK